MIGPHETYKSGSTSLWVLSPRRTSAHPLVRGLSLWMPCSPSAAALAQDPNKPTPVRCPTSPTRSTHPPLWTSLYRCLTDRMYSFLLLGEFAAGGRAGARGDHLNECQVSLLEPQTADRPPQCDGLCDAGGRPAGHWHHLRSFAGLTRMSFRDDPRRPRSPAHFLPFTNSPCEEPLC